MVRVSARVGVRKGWGFKTGYSTWQTACSRNGILENAHQFL